MYLKIREGGEKMSVKTKLAVYRAMINKNQTEFSEELGMSIQTYNQKENGKRSFTVDEMKQIKNLFNRYSLNVTIEDIFF